MGINFARPIKFKTIIYGFVFLALMFILSKVPVTKVFFAKVPIGIKIVMPLVLAWVLSDVGTEDRTPLRFFRSFFKYNFQRFFGQSVYYGKKIEKGKVYKFLDYVEFSEVESVKEALIFMDRKDEIQKESSDDYISRLKEISESSESGVKSRAGAEGERAKKQEASSAESDFADFGEDLFGFSNSSNAETKEKDTKISFDAPEESAEVERAKETGLDNHEEKLGRPRLESIISEKEEEVEYTPPPVQRNVIQASYQEDTDEVKETLKRSDIETPKKPKKKRKRLVFAPLIAFVFITLVGGFIALVYTGVLDMDKILADIKGGENILVEDGDNNYEANGNVSEDNDADNENDAVDELEENLNKALELVAEERYDEAVIYFDKVNFNELTEQEDRELMLLSYLFVGDAKKALELDPAFDEVVITYYEAIEQEGELKKLVDLSDNIHFKVAIIDEDYETIVDMMNDVNIEEEMEVDVMNALLELDLIDEAKDFAETRKNEDLLELIDGFEEDEDDE